MGPVFAVVSLWSSGRTLYVRRLDDAGGAPLSLHERSLLATAAVSSGPPVVLSCAAFASPKRYLVSWDAGALEAEQMRRRRAPTV